MFSIADDAHSKLIRAGFIRQVSEESSVMGKTASLII
jgi:hypothetical protein